MRLRFANEVAAISKVAPTGGGSSATLDDGAGAHGNFSPKRRSSPAARRARAAAGTSGGSDALGEQQLPEGDNGQAFIVTTPLYYVNAAPHMGSAYPTIATDALARFQRLQGRKVVFITGTNEHGEKIAAAVAAQGRQPKDHCDLIAADYQALWKELGISYDRFIRNFQQSP